MNTNSADAKLIATEFGRWPEVLQRVSVAQPRHKLAVEAEGEGFRVSKPETAMFETTEALFPKLAAKSWRDSGSLRVIYAPLPAQPLIEAMLAAPTRAQRVITMAWLEAREPLWLYLFPYVDFSDVSEVRFLSTGSACSRLSMCLRGGSAGQVEARSSDLNGFARGVAAHLPDRPHIIDVALFPSGDLRLVDINPGLVSHEIAALQGRQLG